MFFPAAILLITFSLHPILSAELCKDKQWFDDVTGECQPCKKCPEKAFEIAPCLELSNTMCVNLIEIGRSLNVNLKSRTDPDSVIRYRHKWRETEGPDDGNAYNRNADDKYLAQSESDYYGNLLDKVTCIVLSLTLVCIALTLMLRTITYIRKQGYSCEKRSVARGRLFSRDRLNTTEYMNNLATLDRSLAIDEILEKRKRAIFEPQLLHENIYTDEVFVDLSGVPRNLRDEHPYEELDVKKCLLQMKDQQ